MPVVSIMIIAIVIETILVISDPPFNTTTITTTRQSPDKFPNPLIIVFIRFFNKGYKVFLSIVKERLHSQSLFLFLNRFGYSLIMCYF